ncbi:MAG: FAD:protein FMN transferase [Bacilli bacterium]|nr:FAD:protein FMN transferase [Bacilli bacterium]MBR0194596.1 FAD:protein FMN transferase [Bacilli bacterium]
MKKIIFPLLCCFSLASCAKTETVFEGNFQSLFDTNVSVRIYQGSDENIQELKGILSTFSKETDNYLETDVPGVYTLNQSNNPVTVSSNLYKCLQKGDEISKSLDSYFSICLGSLSKLWKEKLPNGTIPTTDEINSELLKFQNTSITFAENNQVTRNGESEIDLGGIAKGYAIDMCANYFKEKQITQYIVDTTSSILLGEKPSEDGNYIIKIKALQNSFIKAKNICVSTSSIEHQLYVVDGKRYSHIISPETGQAAFINDTCIVLSESGTLGDALATSMMLMSLPEIISMEEEFNVKAIVIRDSKVIYQNEDINIFHG